MELSSILLRQFSYLNKVNVLKVGGILVVPFGPFGPSHGPSCGPSLWRRRSRRGSTGWRDGAAELRWRRVGIGPDSSQRWLRPNQKRHPPNSPRSRRRPSAGRPPTRSSTSSRLRFTFSSPSTRRRPPAQGPHSPRKQPPSSLLHPMRYHSARLTKTRWNSVQFLLRLWRAR